MDCFSDGNDLEDFEQSGFVHEFELDLDYGDFDCDYAEACASEGFRKQYLGGGIRDYHLSAVQTFPYDFEEFTSNMVPHDRAHGRQLLKQWSHELKLFAKIICKTPRKFSMIAEDDCYLYRFRKHNKSLHIAGFCNRYAARVQKTTRC